MTAPRLTSERDREVLRSFARRIDPSDAGAHNNLGVLAQPLAQLGDALVVVAGVEVRDLEVALGDLHLAVELQRLHERRNRFLVEALVEVEHPEVVVRSGVRRIDPSGEGAQDLAIALGREAHDHQATLTTRSIFANESVSGISRKKPRSRSAVSVIMNSLSMQNT